MPKSNKLWIKKAHNMWASMELWSTKNCYWFWILIPSSIDVCFALRILDLNPCSIPTAKLAVALPALFALTTIALETRYNPYDTTANAVAIDTITNMISIVASLGIPVHFTLLIVYSCAN